MAAGGVVFLHGAGEAEGALLNEIQQIQALVLIALGQIHHQPQVGRDHLGFGPLTEAHGAALEIIEDAGRALAPGCAATLLQCSHGLHFAAQSELLLGGEQLMAANFTEIGTQ